MRNLTKKEVDILVDAVYECMMIPEDPQGSYERLIELIHGYTPVTISHMVIEEFHDRLRTGRVNTEKTFTLQEEEYRRHLWSSIKQCIRYYSNSHGAIVYLKKHVNEKKRYMIC